jgi:hypothetical protein
MRAYLYLFGLRDHITTPSGPVAGDKRTVKVPSPDDPAVNVDKEVEVTEEEERKWKENDGQVRALIWINISDDARHCIRDCRTAYSAWQAIEAEYKPQGVCFLFKKFLEMMRYVDEGDDMDKHVARILGCKNTLRDMGLVISNDHLALILLWMLPTTPSWHEVVCSALKQERLDLQYIIRQIRETDAFIKRQRNNRSGQRGRSRRRRREG